MIEGLREATDTGDFHFKAGRLTYRKSAASNFAPDAMSNAMSLSHVHKTKQVASSL